MLDLSTWEKRVRNKRGSEAPGGAGGTISTKPSTPAEASPVVAQPQVFRLAPDQETLRRCTWQIGEARPGAQYLPSGNHVSISMVSPRQGFAHWRIRQEWIDQISRERGHAWTNCRLIIRLYDTTNIVFNGFNANHVQSLTLPAITGHYFFGLPRGGTTQLAEVGFELRGGEFIPAARSQFTRFASEGASGRHDHSALHVDANLKSRPVANFWEQEAFLKEHCRPKLRKPLRIATLAFESAAVGHTGTLSTFVSELAAGTAQAGHEVHVFMPRSEKLQEPRECAGVKYHPLDVTFSDRPIDIALEFARAAEQRLNELPSFDLFHIHEWMAGLAPWIGTRPTVLSLTSTEATRLNGAEPSPVSLEIQRVEHDLLQVIDCVLTPDWLLGKIVGQFGTDATHLHAFPIEGRIANHWDCPLEFGKVKTDFGLEANARLLVYVGPLEHQAGVDLIVEALPIALQRCPQARIVFVGLGGMHGHLQHRAHQLGVGHAVRLFGHMEGPPLARLLRAADAMILPSRGRVHGDEAVVDLARLAGKAVVTTHGGPKHLVQHERTGIVTYDNPGSMVWALDRILGDGSHALRMGENNRRRENNAYSWADVAKLYAEICAECFPELTEPTA